MNTIPSHYLCVISFSRSEDNQTALGDFNRPCFDTIREVRVIFQIGTSTTSHTKITACELSHANKDHKHVLELATMK